MSAPAVVFDHVWKRFALGQQHDSLRDLVPSLTRRLLGRERPAAQTARDFWALRDVSFEVPRGQALGIIGPNGAGKSTTLKLLTRILKPTRGHCEVRGRVGALIEIAAGFHPELTGRENIFLQGAIMGMKRAEIATKLDAIIDFAGVKDFIDTQIKRYSSGMNARLGFAIAAHLDPEVMIIDEVLSVGDMTFQRKCLERMAWFKAQGVSIVFVSHNLQAVTTLCDRALYLHHGLIAHGPTADVLRQYVEKVGVGGGVSDGGVPQITSATLTRGTQPVYSVEPGEALTLRVNYRIREDHPDVTFGFLMYRSTDQLVVYDGNFNLNEFRDSGLRDGESFTIDFDFRANLTRGHYFLECHLYDNRAQRFIARASPIANLTVDETRTYGGVADLAVAARMTASSPVPAGVVEQ